MSRSSFDENLPLYSRVTFYCLLITVYSLSCPGILLGSVSVVRYVELRNIERIYRNTTCHLLNYRGYEQRCYHIDHYHRRRSARASYDPCFDEQFLVSYPIFNGTYVRSSLSTFMKYKRHSQRKVWQILSVNFSLILFRLE